MADQVIGWVEQVRRQQPRLGTRKLYYLLKERLEILSVGRDKLFLILRANHLLQHPRRLYRTTTQSYHRFSRHKNLIKELVIQRPEQVWVSDITYLGNRTHPCYLSLVTDAYSKYIMGYHVSDRLDTRGCLEALSMATKQRRYPALPLIHHSDKGVQYCCDLYQKRLQRKHIGCSMTEKHDPYQNAVAERVNGILKQEFLLDQYPGLTLAAMRKIVAESIAIYNTLRPHYSCYMLTPAQAHAQDQLIIRTYKKTRLDDS